MSNISNGVKKRKLIDQRHKLIDKLYTLRVEEPFSNRNGYMLFKNQDAYDSWRCRQNLIRKVAFLDRKLKKMDGGIFCYVER